jgi:hypothetical protein
MGYVVWTTLNVPLEVKEPIEILNYPSQLSLYPAESFTFNVTVQNHDSMVHSVTLHFHLSNSSYQTSYVTFSDQIYKVVNGQQNFTAWVKVSPDAPKIITQLSIDFSRGAYYYGLVGYWKLDEGSGQTVYDSSGNHNNGDRLGDGLLWGEPKWVDGKYGKALTFDGIWDFVSISDSSSLRVQSFSIGVWVYMTVRPYQAGHSGFPHVCIVNKFHQYNTPAKAGYKLDFENPTATDDTLVITVGDGVAQRLVQYNSINDLTLDHWHQIVGTYDGSTAKIYIDGRLKATGQGSYTILHDSTPLCFSREITQYEYDGFNGLMDNVMLYNRTLSSEEIHELYLNPLP